MNEDQQSIYNGLKSIGEEISSFYKDGLSILNNENIKTKSNLLAHIAREIHGGLRDILAPDEAKAELLKDPELKDRGNVVSILVALDLPINDPFALKYIKITAKFAKFTHRRGATKSPRNPKEVIKLWEEYEEVLLKLIGSFINELKQIERITRFKNPTKAILLALKNILKENQKERHFYIKLNEVNWLESLYDNDFFSPEDIVDGIYWNQSEYLEFLSIQIKEFKIDKEYSKILIKIIQQVSEYSINVKQINNDRIWYTFIKILTNLPKVYINDEIINYFPFYLKTNQENILQSEVIFEFIYSCFANEEFLLDNKSKIEKLIKLVFEISDKNVFKDESTYEVNDFYPIIRSYKLKKESDNDFFNSSIAKYCSDEVIYYVAENLLIHLKSNYGSDFSFKSIFHFQEIDKSSHSIKTIYTIFLKNCCQKIADLSDIRINEVLRAFLSNKFHHQQFTKLALFLFSKTWHNTKSIFFELIKNQDEKMLFSNQYLGDDLYFLLEIISCELSSEESLIIKKIIDNGSKNEHYYNRHLYLNDYKLFWYSALSNNHIFNEGYVFLSKKMGFTKDQLRPKIRPLITSGSISPKTIEEIKNFSIKELVNTLKNFDPERSFRSPSVEGFADNICSVIKEKPELFIDNYEYFYEIPYRYISSIFNGLDSAWNNNDNIDWNNILKFIQNYILQKEFGTEILQLKNTSYKHDFTDTIRSFCRLLSSGMKKDENAFSKELLPLAENIIFNFLENHILTELEGNNKGKLGSAMHAINSTTGIIIGCLIDCSLRKGRLKNNDVNDKTPRWSILEKKVYESLIDKGVQEFYMYFGWLRENFYFLDYKWTNDLIKLIPSKDTQTLKSYFGCHLLKYNTSKLDYKIFKDTYKKAVNEDWQVVDSSMGDNSIELHTTVFYIFDFEDLNENEIITLILEQGNINKIRKVIHSLSFKFDQYYEELTLEDKKLFKRKVFRLWEYILSVFEESKDIETKDMPNLFYLMKFIDELDEESLNLLKKTSYYAKNRRDFDELIKNLNRLKTKGNIQESSIYACEIFIESVLGDSYYASIMEKEIIEFVDFLYFQKAPILKKYSNKICNQFAEKGQYFLRDLYEKNNI